MHVLVPSGSCMYPLLIQSGSSIAWKSGVKGSGYYPVLFDGSYDLVSVPTYWHATSGRPYNDVCHGKPTGVSEGDCLSFFDRGQFFPARDVSYEESQGDYPLQDFARFTTHYQALSISSANLSTQKAMVVVQAYLCTFRLNQKYSDFLYYYRYYNNIQVRATWTKGNPTPTLEMINPSLYATQQVAPILMSALLKVDSTAMFGNDHNKKRWAVMNAIHECQDPIFHGYMADEIFMFGLTHMIRSSRIYLAMSQCRKLEQPPLPSVDPSSMLFHEEDIYIRKDSPLLFGKDNKNYWRSYLISEAYYDACRNVPRLNDNSVSNILEIGGFIKSLLIDHRVEIPRSLSDAWLRYRYQYGTGKLDVEEAIQFVHRHMDLQGVNEITSYGQAHTTLDGVDVTCRCCFHVSPKDVGTLDNLWRALYTYGLAPDFYVIWDMIPYSFIVDWLIPIGEIAGRMDASVAYSGTYYDIRDIQFSLSYDTISDTGVYTHWYTRWLQGTPPELRGVYAFEKQASQRTWGYRALDTLSLLIK